MSMYKYRQTYLLKTQPLSHMEKHPDHSVVPPSCTWQNLKFWRQKEKSQGHPGGQLLRCWSELCHEGPVGSMGLLRLCPKLCLQIYSVKG